MLYHGTSIQKSYRRLCMTIGLLLTAYQYCGDTPSVISLSMMHSDKRISNRLALGLLIVSIPIARKIYTTLTNIHRGKLALNVGVVPIVGTITESTDTVALLKELFENSAIDAIVLAINSGGGAPGASQAIYYTIKQLKEFYKKPVIAWVENIAASGAYYIAAAADTIVCTPAALIGSIGVISAIPQLNNLLKTLGIEHEILTSGSYKAAGDPRIALKPNNRSMLQRLSDNIYKQFVYDMKVSRAALDSSDEMIWADGQIFDAQEGQRIGLVDCIGTQITVEAVIHEKLGNDTPIKWILPKQPTLFQEIFGRNRSTKAYGTNAIEWIVQQIYTLGVREKTMREYAPEMVSLEYYVA